LLEERVFHLVMHQLKQEDVEEEKLPRDREERKDLAKVAEGVNFSFFFYCHKNIFYCYNI
jgi:hypothetical protein